MASTGRNTTFILLIMLSIVVFLFLNMVLGSVRIPMSAVWHIFTGTGDEPQTGRISFGNRVFRRH